ncbi:MAG: PDZ domain-containing protein, partial [Patescibacteria group bacterium]
MVNLVKKFVPLAVGAVLLAGGLFYFGYYLGSQNPQNIVISGVQDLNNPELVKADFGIFWQAWDKIKTEHIDGEKAKDLDLVYGSISGMVDALKDPHTMFFPPEDSKKFEEDVRGNFGGIGAEIGIRNDQLVVIAPLKDSPAEKIGLLALDKIVQVDGESTVGWDVNEGVKNIRGEIGTTVKLSILRNGWESV